MQFPATEVGAVSPPCTIQLSNHGDTPVDVASLDLVMHGGTSEPARPGEFELIQRQPRRLWPGDTTGIEVVFRPTRVVRSIGARLRATGQHPHERLDVRLQGTPAAPRADHADLRELSVAEHSARRLEEITATPSVSRYGDMLAAVLAARNLTARTAADAHARASVIKLLEPVARRLDQLNDHHGRLATFGAGNIAGQMALDMSQAAIRSWLQRLQLGARIHTDELVTKFRAGAEPIRFLTGERADAPALRAFDRASRATAIGTGALVLAPGLVALAGEEASLLAFAARVPATRVTLWAITHPAAALAAGEALLALGIQIGEDGWEPFWNQLHDPRGRWFIVAQVLMDYMHVKTGMSGHGGRPGSPRNTPHSAVGIDATPGTAAPGDVAGARERITALKAIVRRVHDAAATGHEAEPASAQLHPGRLEAHVGAERDAHASSMDTLHGAQPQVSTNRANTRPDAHHGQRSAHAGADNAVEAKEVIHEPASPANEQSATNNRSRVVTPVPGLFDGVETKAKIADWKIFDALETRQDGTKTIKTTIITPDGHQGLIQRKYDPRSKTLVMLNAFLDELPRWIDVSGPGLTAKKGTPTVTYLTIRQMKLMGIAYGSLKHVKMSTIQNVRAVIEFNAQLAEGIPPEVAVMKTHSILYADTTMIQSGSKIISAKVAGTIWRTPLQTMLRHFETRAGAVAAVPTTVARHDRLLAEYGRGKITRDSIVEWNYDVELEVAPFESE